MLLNCGVGEDSWVPRSARRFNQSILKEISPEYSGRTDAEGKTPILWPPDAKSWLIWKDPDYGKDWGQEEKGTTEDEMVGWHHWLNGHEFEKALGVGDGQGSLACCSPSGSKESDMTEQLNWTELNQKEPWKKAIMKNPTMVREKLKNWPLKIPLNLEGWDEEGDGREFQEWGDVLWLVHIEVWQKTTKFCKAIILQLKNKLKNKLKTTTGCLR